MARPQYATVAHAGAVEELQACLPEKSVIADAEACKAYSTRGMAEAAHSPLAVVLVETTADVQTVLQICRRHDLRVLPRGAGTNLTSAVSPSLDTVILCTSRMRKISDFDPIAGTIRVEAGVRNQAISDHVQAFGWCYAPDPSSRRNCTIGGNVATNSGGSSCLRSGVTVNHVAGLKIVLFDGTMIDLGGESYDAEGLDLASLICGSEGRTGIVTEVVLRLSPLQPVRSALMLAFDHRSDALAAGKAILESGLVPAQMDYMDARTVELCEAVTSPGYPSTAGGIVLVDLVGATDSLVEAEETIRRIAVLHTSDCRIFTTSADRARIWGGRERIYGAAARVSRYVATDAAVPLSQLSGMLAAVDECAEAFGLTHATTVHMGDGTVHSFLFYDDQSPESCASVEACATTIRKSAIQLGGTATSEYGVGTRHLHLLTEQFSEIDLGVQQRCIEALQTDVRLGAGLET